MKTGKPRTASIYARISVDASESVRIDRDMADLEDLAERHGLRIVRRRTDRGQSGGKRQREAFRAWLQDGREGHVLLVSSVDRISREGLQGVAEVLDVVEGKGRDGQPVSSPTRLITADGVDTANDDTRMILVVKGEVARAERQRAIERVRGAQAYMVSVGRFVGGSAPYGYRIVPNPEGDGKVLEPDPEEAEAVQTVAEMLLSGTSWLAASRWMNWNAPKPHRADMWSAQALVQVVCGDPIVGRVRFRGELVRDEAGVAVSVFKPVLAAATVERLRALRTERKRGPKKRASRLLSSIIRCAGCEAPMRVHTVADRRRAYTCGTRQDGGICPASTSIVAENVERYVEAEYLATYGGLQLPPRLVRVEEAEELAAIAEAEADVMRRMRSAVPSEIPSLANRLSELRTSRGALEGRERFVLEEGPLRTIAETWQERSLEQRREDIRGALVDGRILVRKGTQGRRGLDPERLIFSLDPAAGTDITETDIA